MDHHQTVDRFFVLGSTAVASSQAATVVRHPSIADQLRAAGYRTYMIGTWDSGESAALHPGARGFESFHVLLSMAGDYYPPTGANKPLERESFKYMEDGALVPPPEGYITDFWTEKLIAYLQRDARDSKPFFAYAAYTTPHFPLHAPDEFVTRYRGRYSAGYDAVRLARIAEQKKRGIISRDFKPAEPVPSSFGYKTWQQLTQDERTFEARRMEIYAAMIENLDWNVGRIVQALKTVGKYDNTLILVTSTNGAAQALVTHRSPAGIDNSLENIGRRNSWIAYTERWAEVSNAPFSRWKAKATEGGIVVPLVVRWPNSVRTGVTGALATFRDLTPTLLDAAGIVQTQKSRMEQNPVASLLPLWRGNAATVHKGEAVFIDEHRDEAYVRQDNWKAVLISDTAINAFDGSDPANADFLAAMRTGDIAKATELRAKHPSVWKLYDLRQDRGETSDLASRNPDKLHELVERYERYRRDNSSAASSAR